MKWFFVAFVIVVVLGVLVEPAQARPYDCIPWHGMLVCR